MAGHVACGISWLQGSKMSARPAQSVLQRGEALGWLLQD